MAINIEWQVIGGSEGQVRWFTRQGQCTCPSDPTGVTDGLQPAILCLLPYFGILIIIAKRIILFAFSFSQG